MDEEPVLALGVTPISLSSNGLLKDAGSEEVSATLSLSALICPSWYNDDEEDDEDDEEEEEEEEEDDKGVLSLFFPGTKDSNEFVRELRF